MAGPLAGALVNGCCELMLRQVVVFLSFVSDRASCSYLRVSLFAVQFFLPFFRSRPRPKFRNRIFLYFFSSPF